MSKKDVTDGDNIEEITDEMWDNARPASEVLPELFGAEAAKKLCDGEFTVRPVGRPKQEDHKIKTTIRFDSDIIEEFRSHGKGWQTEINNILRDWIDHRSHTNNPENRPDT